MKWFLFFGAVVAFLSFQFVKRSNKNVCKTFKDYYSNRDQNENCYYNPDYNLKVPEIIVSRGYPVETHHVTTQDGYILTVFRIPHGKKFNNGKRRQPVFIQHGLGLNSECFINRGKKSLGFILADAGYDVWLGNFRGTTYSRNHTELSDSDRRFWNFCVHEMGIYDIPAQLDVVESVTKQKIIYIGFSIGTSTAFIYGITYPEIAKEKVKIFISLAPAVIMKEWKSVTRYLFPFWEYAEPIIHTLTNGAVYMRTFPPSSLRQLLCLPFPFQMDICLIIDMLTWGFDYEQNDPETLPITLLRNIDACSVKTLSHVIQNVQSGKFENFNYGAKANKILYGSSEPQQYNLSKLQVPVYLVRGENDLLVTKKNVETLNSSLPKKVKPYDIYVVKYEKFNHGDFLTARDVVPLLYNHLVTFIKAL